MSDLACGCDRDIGICRCVHATENASKVMRLAFEDAANDADAMRSALGQAANDAGDLAEACCALIDCAGWAKWSDEALDTQHSELRRVLRRVLKNLERFDDLRQFDHDGIVTP